MGTWHPALAPCSGTPQWLKSFELLGRQQRNAVATAGGDALIYGQSISSAGGINAIRSLMGVCPQFDVLWNELTAKEHLEIYGSVKVSTGAQRGIAVSR